MTDFDFALKSLALGGGDKVHYYSLPSLESEGLGNISRFPYSVRVLLESLIRLQSHPAYKPEHVTEFAKWTPESAEKSEYPYLPARILLQDFTGVPCVVDLAALRSAMQRAGKNPDLIEPQLPVDLIIDHSVQIDSYGTEQSLEENIQMEFERNTARYEFLRWGQGAFERLNIVPPGLGICHQINLEHLAKCVVLRKDAQGRTVALPDTLVGTDSHTTMINGIGVLGWGVGGIEAEAAMLGQPIPIRTPEVVGVRLIGELQAGVTATDLALRVTQMLRETGVVEKFVEYFGDGLDHLTLADRATVANMAPEYGATMGFFPIDNETLRYLRETGRTEEEIDLVDRYCHEQGLFRTPESEDPEYSDVVTLDLGSVEPCIAGPKRPQERLTLGEVKPSFTSALTRSAKDKGFGVSEDKVHAESPVEGNGSLKHGSIVIASITSCTNTSNPHVLIAAGILAKKAVERGLTVKKTVKTSLAPGSRVVTAYLRNSGLLKDLEQLGFDVVAYGCATCIGNSGPLDPAVEKAITDGDIVASAVLSGNRNFEGRVHALSKANYLCSPPLVVAYALAGTVDTDLMSEPLGTDTEGKPVYLKELWPSEHEIGHYIGEAADPELYKKLYKDIAQSNPAWNKLSASSDAVYGWNPDSTYIQEPPFVADLPTEAPALVNIEKAYVLGLFGDFITTDHISPAGAIPEDGPAGKYLMAHGVAPVAFNSFGSRRGNHEVMMRGTFANIRIRNLMVDREGGWTVHVPSDETMFIYDAAMKYRETATPLVILAGKMYGAGSSRDWAAKGTELLGVKAVIAESFERIHRSNLVEMGVLPLEFTDGQTAGDLGLTGTEKISISGVANDFTPGKVVDITAEKADGTKVDFSAKSRIDSAIEIDYYRHGGILAYVLRQAIVEAG